MVMMDRTDVEAAAKALWEFDEEPNAEGLHGPTWEQANEWEREDYRKRVRVVLEASDRSSLHDAIEEQRAQDRASAESDEFARRFKGEA